MNASLMKGYFMLFVEPKIVNKQEINKTEEDNLG